MNEYLGVDLGGTQMRMAAVSGMGELISEMYSVPTGKTFSPEQMHQQLSGLRAQVAAAFPTAQFVGLGIGTTGLVGDVGIIQADFLPLLDGVNLIELVQNALSLPARVENDARCFVLAEARFGAARGCNNVVGLTLGTGVGGGVMIDGKVIRGANRYAGEVWGIPLRGKWMEYFVSGEGIVRAYHEQSQPMSPYPAQALTAENIAELARKGNEQALQAYEMFATDLWALCETIRSLLDPEVVVIGGSIAQSRDIFGQSFHAKLDERGPQVVWAGLGNAAGVIGAASLMMEPLTSSNQVN